MKELLNRSYAAIEGRGLIDQNTTLDDFFDKMEEEQGEIYGADNDENLKEELNDLSTVCQMCIMWLGGNPVEEFEKGVEKNERRAKDHRSK